MANLFSSLIKIFLLSAQYHLPINFPREKKKRQKNTTIRNTFQQNDLILWNPREHESSFRSSKLAPKFLGPNIVQKQLGHDITCRHVQMNTNHVFHSPILAILMTLKTCSVGQRWICYWINQISPRQLEPSSVHVIFGQVVWLLHSWKYLGAMEFSPANYPTSRLSQIEKPLKIYPNCIQKKFL